MEALAGRQKPPGVLLWVAVMLEEQVLQNTSAALFFEAAEGAAAEVEEELDPWVQLARCPEALQPAAAAWTCPASPNTKMISPCWVRTPVVASRSQARLSRLPGSSRAEVDSSSTTVSVYICSTAAPPSEHSTE